ncbi:beta-propeller domain-containing protein [Candidatus Woesearchaeota archaeon]|nr:beta-propeller domain-containing protein [Candidatus Woesearchaeota archaeon]
MKNKNINGFLILTFLVLNILVISCKPIVEKETIPIELQSTQELKKFSSAQEIRDFLKNAAVSGGYSDIFVTKGLGVTRVASSQLAEAVGAPSVAKSADSGGAVDYSTTNIQVAGVDEADFVKNDGKYIYALTQNRLVIVDAFPAENAKILSETKIDGNARDLFVNKDRLVVFADDSNEIPVFAEFDFVPRPRYTPITHAYVYDISDREKPKLVKDYNLNGNYYQSRMIEDYVYFIVIENVYYYGPLIDLPVVRAASATIVKPDVFYFDNPEENYNFNTIASFNIFEDKDKVNAKTFMMGYTNNLYVSQNNIYITYQKNLPYRYYEKHNEERFYDVVAPLLPSDAQSKIKAVREYSSLNSHEKWDKISAILEETYNKMDEDEKEELFEKIAEAIDEYEARLEAERRKTVIHKIKINNGDIDYGSRGEVPGYLLNQFSMDEYNDYFRVATTTEFYGRVPVPLPVEATESRQTSSDAPQVAKQSEAVVASKPMSIAIPRPIRESRYVMYNNVYVLDNELKIVGKLEAIAPDERIYSTRFIGDRLYMVTFKRIDPLFVIDLSNPESPEILGELKIPGFSDYLHPYDENHIIGVGKETDSNEWGGVSIHGVKLALFDVSDVKNPKQLDKYEIGEAGTDSEALRDHKSFLFDKKKNLLVIPVTEVKGKQYYDPRLGYYRQRFWQGAYVFSLTPEGGFKVKGKITHNEGDEQRDYYYYGSPNAVRRALYMDDALYTVSGIKIKANDLSNIDNEIKEVKLPYEKERYYDYPYVKAVEGSAVVSVPTSVEVGESVAIE